MAVQNSWWTTSLCPTASVSTSLLKLTSVMCWLSRQKRLSTIRFPLVKYIYDLKKTSLPRACLPSYICSYKTLMFFVPRLCTLPSEDLKFHFHWPIIKEIRLIPGTPMLIKMQRFSKFYRSMQKMGRVSNLGIKKMYLWWTWYNEQTLGLSFISAISWPIKTCQLWLSLNIDHLFIFIWPLTQYSWMCTDQWLEL